MSPGPCSLQALGREGGVPSAPDLGPGPQPRGLGERAPGRWLRAGGPRGLCTLGRPPAGGPGRGHVSRWPGRAQPERYAGADSIGPPHHAPPPTGKHAAGASALARGRNL